MNTKEKIKKEFIENIADVAKLLLFLEGKLKKEIHKEISFQTEFQIWYSKAIKLVETFGKERLLEFKSYYEIDPKRKSMVYGTYVIQDFLKGVMPNTSCYSDFDAKGETIKNIYNQFTILNAIFERFDTVLYDVQSELLNELQELELKNAKSLLKINIRASGVIAGVILENHLAKVVENHDLKIPKKNSTLSDFNECLKNQNIYNTTTWKKILYLGDLRNICAHKKDKDPTVDQVEELLEGVNWAMKNIY
jgi:hypothetical protein